MTAVAALSLLANVVIYQRLTPQRPILTVAGTTVTKRQYQAGLEEEAGKQVLRKIVFAELVGRAAARAGVVPTGQDIDTRLASLQSQNPKTSSIPAYRLRAAVATDLALENLRIKAVSVTKAEVQRYYDTHLSSFSRQGGVAAEMVVTKTETDAQTAAHLFQQGVDPSFIAKQPGFQLVGANGFTVDLRQPSRRSIVKALYTMTAGSVQIFPLAGNYLTVKVYERRDAGPAPLSQVKDQAVRLAKLEKAPSAQAEMLTLYKADKPTFLIDRYSAYFEDVDKAVAARNTH